MSSQEFTSEKLHCHNEYGVLKKVIVVSPRYMDTDRSSNEMQKKSRNKNIHIETAMKQHKDFVSVLEANGVEVIYLESKESLYEQVFTRDIGFCLGNNLFVATMGRTIRKQEENVIMKWLKEHQYPFDKIETSSIEGGDVIIDGQTIWIGVSDRTSEAAIQQLSNKLKGYYVHSLPLANNILHLDCAFNVLSNDTAIVYSKALTKEDLQVLQKHYKLIEITDEEQLNLATNVLSIGNKKIVSLAQNDRINNVLRGNGFEVIEVEFSEIIKSNGSFRCCSMPLLRE
ncbi:dimethylarginine dimethylaminohydrolase family protein [Bacillus seohaeanensis]|jgi:N-dimethylarginine dimethylaminohydrolase|uniref:Dimethylarginine dimethylaminohydrolase family protein n=1 Tax=Bacillus seohaeanensis TaxID=284580 RepID=A0ABW5RNH2_9BACI